MKSQSQLKIKLGLLIREELDASLKKIKSRKAAHLYEVSLEIWKTRKFEDILL